EPCTESDGSKNSQLVFLKSCEWIANRSDEPGFNIGTAIDVIDDAVFYRVVQKAVNCEVTPQHILLRVGESHAAWPSPIDVSIVGTKGRHFESVSLVDNENHAELCANAFGPRKNLHDLFRGGACGNVIIGRLDLHNHIAHTSAHKIGFMSFSAQFTDDGYGR